jgi:hypothetical protein
MSTNAIESERQLAGRSSTRCWAYVTNEETSCKFRTERIVFTNS